MARTDNTNNSLTDLNNDGFLYSDWLSKDQIQTNNSENNRDINESVRKLQREKFDLEQQYQKTQNGSDEQISISQKIADKQKEIQRLLEQFNYIENDDLRNRNSLFNRNGIIDYARVSDALTINWDNYGKEGEGSFNYGEENQFSSFTLNTPVQSKTNALNTADYPSEDGLTLPHLVEWSENYPALQLRYQDFSYCKKLGYYPNNRLVILRRFKDGVPDNLFDYISPGNDSLQSFYYNQPLATMITWLQEDQSPLEIQFNENYEDNNQSITSMIKQGIQESIWGHSDESSFLSGGLEALVSSLTESIGENYQRKNNVPFYKRDHTGNPNLITQSKKRVTGGGGLSSTVSFNFTFEYEMRYINGVDPGIAMMDLIANCLRMGTSVSEFKYRIPALTDNDLIKRSINGDISDAGSKFVSELKEFTDNITSALGDMWDSAVDTVTQGDFSGFLSSAADITNKAIKFTISRYRERLKAALSSDTGLPSGKWHITIGNPKAPIVSCGDLIIKSSTLNLGTELGYNDFPTEFSVTYQLESARERGRDELSQIMNAGRGRVYVYEDHRLNPDYDLYSQDTQQNQNND